MAQWSPSFFGGSTSTGNLVRVISAQSSFRRNGTTRQFRLFLRVQVIQIAVEFLEAVRRRQKFVAVAEVVLAELRGRVAQRVGTVGARTGDFLTAEVECKY